jgi:hypothetical protein
MKLFISVHKRVSPAGGRPASSAEPLAEGITTYHARVGTSGDGTAALPVEGGTVEELGGRIVQLMREARGGSSCRPEFNLRFAPDADEKGTAPGPEEIPFESSEISRLFRIIGDRF